MGPPSKNDGSQQAVHKLEWGQQGHGESDRTLHQGTVAYWFHPDTKLEETTCPFIEWKEGNDQTIHYKWAGDRFSLTRGTMLTESMTMADAPEGVTSKTQGRNPN